MQHSSRWRVERRLPAPPPRTGQPAPTKDVQGAPLPGPAQQEGLKGRWEPLTAYWNFSLYSRSLARALLSSSATEQHCGQEQRTEARPTLWGSH